MPESQQQQQHQQQDRNLQQPLQNVHNQHSARSNNHQPDRTMSSTSAPVAISTRRPPPPPPPQHQHSYHQSQPMERVLFNLHHQMCSFVLRYSSSRSRSWAERFLLFLSVCGFGALLLAHMTFVHRTTSNLTVPAKCLSSVPGFTLQANVTHIYVMSANGDSTNSEGMGSYAYTLWPRANASMIQGGTCENAENNGGEGAKDSPPQECSSKRIPLQDFPSNAYVVHQLSYSRVKGYLLLSSLSSIGDAQVSLASEHSISVQYVFVSKRDWNCFGEPFLQQVVFSLLGGPETVALNWCLAMHDSIMARQYESNKHHIHDDFTLFSPGFVYNPQTDALMELRPTFAPPVYHHYHHGRPSSYPYDHPSYQPPPRRQKMNGHHEYHRRLHSSSQHWSYFYGLPQLAGSKLSVVLKTCFLYFITTTLVSFTLRETQERMLDFTKELQRHVRNRRPVARLVTHHFVDNLVFVPIMVGIIFFLIEFYSGNKILAFLVLSLVWMVEAYSVISVRSFAGIHFFPKIFFLLFALLHFYVFSFPFGFSYTALASAVCFMAHSMLFFWHRFELPAVVMGQVTADHPRMYHTENMNSASPPPYHANGDDQRARVDTTGWNTGVTDAPQISYSSNQASHVLTQQEPQYQYQYPHQHQQYNHHNQGGPTIVTAAPAVRGNNGMSRRTSSRQSLQRIRSYGTLSSHGGVGMNISRQTSATGLFHQGELEDDGSYMYFMGGEVVMHSSRPRGAAEHVSHSNSNSSNMNMNQNQKPSAQRGGMTQPLPTTFLCMQPSPGQTQSADPLIISPLESGSEHSQTRVARALPNRVVTDAAVGDEFEKVAEGEQGHVPLPSFADLPQTETAVAGTEGQQHMHSSPDADIVQVSLPQMLVDELDLNATAGTLSNSHETPIRDNRGGDGFIHAGDPRVIQAPQLPNAPQLPKSCEPQQH